MNDEADSANDLIQYMMDAGVEIARHNAKKKPSSSGRCLWCEEPVAVDRRWCSPECRDDHEKRTRKK